MTLIAVLLTLGAFPDESDRRQSAISAYGDPSPSTRAEAVRTLDRCKGEPTIRFLATALADPAAEVRAAAAETLQTCVDADGLAIAPLAALLADKKEKPDLRLKAAGALSRALYRTGPIQAMIDTISNISKSEPHLFSFGADVTRLLNRTAGQDFGADKVTAEKWQNWWKDHEARVRKEDDQRRAALGKPPGGK